MRPDEHVQRIVSVDFCESPFSNSMLNETWEIFVTKILDCLNRNDFDCELHRETDPYYVDHGPSYRHEYLHGADSHDIAPEHPCSELKKILGGGTFYYSLTFDLTNRLQDRYVKLIIIMSVGESYDRLEWRRCQHLISII